MKKLIIISLFISLLAVGIYFTMPAEEVNAGNMTVSQAQDMVNSAIETFSGYNYYSCKMYKRERLDSDDDDDDIINELVEVKWRRSPDTFFMKFLASTYGRHPSGLAFLYPDRSGECDSDEIITNEVGRLTPQCIDPHGMVGTMGTRHPVDEGNMSDMLGIFHDDLALAARTGDSVTITADTGLSRGIGGGRITDDNTGTSVTIPSQTVRINKYTVTFPSSRVKDEDDTWAQDRGSLYYARQAEIWLNLDTNLPCFIKSWDKNNVVVEWYTFINLSNSGSANDFNPCRIGGFDVDC